MTDSLTPLAWPRGLAPADVGHHPRAASVIGPSSQTQLSNVLQSDAGYWDITLSGVPVGGSEKVQDYRALLSNMENGAIPVLVPAWDYQQSPWVSGDWESNTLADVGFTGGYKFTGGYGFYNSPIRVYLNGAHALRATTIAVTVTSAGAIRAGMMFSLYGERLHVIREKLSATSWRVWPPLRRDYPAGLDIPLEFARPTMKARLISPTVGDLVLRHGRYGYVDLTFREAT